MSVLSGVTPADVRAASFGSTIPDGVDVDAALTRLIDKAEIRILARVPDLADRLSDGRTNAEVLSSVVEDMVLRVTRNPDGKKSESIDDYSWTLDASVASGMLYLSDDELALIVPPASSRRTVGSIRLGVPSWRLPR